MDPRIGDIRRKVARAGTAGLDDIDAVDDILEAEGPNVELLLLRGQLIQLVSEGDPEELEEAFACYQEALELEPENASIHEEIGHFLDACADDPAEAVIFFKKAIALGAGESAEEGLTEALSQLDTEEL
jgi:tetratricopeptide (TPR) repeat protein